MLSESNSYEKMKIKNQWKHVKMSYWSTVLWKFWIGAGSRDSEIVKKNVYLYISRHIVLISGLEIGSKEEEIFTLQLFVDMVTGMLGNSAEEGHSSEICRVIVAGNSLSASTQDKDSLQKVQHMIVDWGGHWSTDIDWFVAH